MPRLSAALLLALTTALATGCASGRSAGPTGLDGERVAREHAYTQLLEIRVGGESAVGGYLVEFTAVPLGIRDERPYPVGTVLVQDADMRTVGFVTPAGSGFAFDEDGWSHPRGRGARADVVGLILGTREPLRFRALVVGR